MPIIKIKPSKTPRFRQIIMYFEREQWVAKEQTMTFQLSHNLRSEAPEDVIKEFKLQDKFRVRRKGGNCLTHEIISFSPKSRKYITLEILEDITQYYFDQRNPRGVYYAIGHFDKDHYHVHICAHACEYHSSKSIAMSFKEFEDLRHNVENYTVSQYPVLHDSIAYIDKPRRRLDFERSDKNTRREKLYQLKQRTGEPADVDKAANLVREVYDQSVSREDFYDRIRNLGMEVYTYRGKVKGVLYNERKYRFKRLSLTALELLKLDQRERKLELELNADRRKKKQLELIRVR